MSSLKIEIYEVQKSDEYKKIKSGAWKDEMIRVKRWSEENKVPGSEKWNDKIVKWNKEIGNGKLWALKKLNDLTEKVRWNEIGSQKSEICKISTF